MVRDMTRNSNVPVVMLVNYGDPLASGVGELFLNAMLADYPRDRLVRFSTPLRPVALSPIDWNGSPAYLDTVPSSALPVYSSWLDRRYRTRQLSVHAQRTLTLIDKHKVDLLWIVLNHPTTIHLAHLLVTRVDIPVVAAVWDPPEWFIDRQRFDRATKHMVLAEFAEVLQRAARVVSISRGMTDSYRDRYGVESTPMVFCPPTEMWRSAKESRVACSGNLDVIFAGSLYAWREWDSFLDAVEFRNRDNTAQRIRVTCMGRQSRWTKKRKWVTYIEHQSMAQATDAVCAADVAYLPYWQDARHAYITRTAFPSKLPSYLAAGVPILYHGPRDSTPAWFLAEYPVGVCCHTHRRDDILNALDACVKDPEFLRQYPQARQRTFEEAFHPRIIVDRFRRILAEVCYRTTGRQV